MDGGNRPPDCRAGEKFASSRFWNNNKVISPEHIKEGSPDGHATLTHQYPRLLLARTIYLFATGDGFSIDAFKEITGRHRRNVHWQPAMVHDPRT